MIKDIVATLAGCGGEQGAGAGQICCYYRLNSTNPYFLSIYTKILREMC